MHTVLFEPGTALAVKKSAAPATQGPGFRWARMLLGSDGVRVLEARFHPATKAREGFVVVGRVLCDQNQASIEHAEIAPEAVRPFQSARLHARLEFLVESVVSDHLQGLVGLESGYWSFVETTDDVLRGGAA